MFTRIMGKHPVSATMRDAVCNKAVVRPTNAARATVDVPVKRLCVPTYAACYCVSYDSLRPVCRFPRVLSATWSDFLVSE